MVKFATYIEQNKREAWKSQYIRYKELKQLLYEILETDAPVGPPRTLSLTIQDPSVARRRETATPQEQFFLDLEVQVATVNSFTMAQAQLLRDQLRIIESRLRKVKPMSGGGGLEGSGPSLTATLSGPGSPRRTSISGITLALQGPGSGTDGAGGQGTGEAAGMWAGPSGQQPLSPTLQGRRSEGGALVEARMQRQQQASVSQGSVAQRYTWPQLQADAQAVGLEYLALEKYVNLNYAALQKILKKHDKLVPSAPCWAFYRLHTSHLPWVRGEHHDIQATLARVFSKLHSMARQPSLSLGPSRSLPSADNALAWPQGGDGAQAPQALHVVETVRKFWVRMEDLAELEYDILQHLPVCGLNARMSDHDADPQDPTNNYPRATRHARAGSWAPGGVGGGGANMSGEQSDGGGAERAGVRVGETVNLVYLDNASLELYHNLLYGRPYAALVRLRWVGDRLRPHDTVQLQRKVYREGWRPDTSVKDSFPLEEKRVAEFLAGRWTFADARKHLLTQTAQVRRPSTTQSAQDLRRAAFAAGRPATALGPPGAGPSASAFAHASAITGGGGMGTPVQYPGTSFRTYGMGAGPVPSQQSAYDSIASMAEEMEATQREYALFKTFTEVQRSVEVKALQPVVRLRMHQTVYQDTSLGPREALARAQAQGGPGAACVTRVQIDTRMRALLEYSTDGQSRIANNLWHQARPADAVDFPYGCVTVVLACPEHELMQHGGWHPTSLPPWLQQLVDTGKLLEIQDFSKFLFGCAGLLPDMVRALPVWIDDPLLQRCLAAQVLHPAQPPPDPQGNGKPMHPASIGWSLTRQTSHRRPSVEGSSLGLGSSGPSGPMHMDRKGSAKGKGGAKDSLSEPLLSSSQGRQRGSAGTSPHMSQGVGFHHPLSGERLATQREEGSPHSGSGTLPDMLRVASKRLSNELKGWQVKLYARQQSRGRVYQPQALFVDPGQFLRNERIFITWLTMSITLSGLACGMLGFAATAHRDPNTISILHICEATAFAQLAMAIIMCGYGLTVFLWRSVSLYELRPHRYDDTRGSMMLNMVLVATFTALMLLNVYDFITQAVHGTDSTGGGGGSGGGGTPDEHSDYDALLGDGGTLQGITGRCGGCAPYWGVGGCGRVEIEQRPGGAWTHAAEAGACALVQGAAWVQSWWQGHHHT